MTLSVRSAQQGGPTVKAKKSASQVARDSSTLEKLGISSSHQVKEISNNIARKREVLHAKLFNDTDGDSRGSHGKKSTLQKVVSNKSEPSNFSHGLNDLFFQGIFCQPFQRWCPRTWASTC